MQQGCVALNERFLWIYQKYSSQFLLITYDDEYVNISISSSRLGALKLRGLSGDGHSAGGAVVNWVRLPFGNDSHLLGQRLQRSSWLKMALVVQFFFLTPPPLNVPVKTEVKTELLASPQKWATRLCREVGRRGEGRREGGCLIASGHGRAGEQNAGT